MVVCPFSGLGMWTPWPDGVMSVRRNGEDVTMSCTRPSTAKLLLHHHAAPTPAARPFDSDGGAWARGCRELGLRRSHSGLGVDRNGALRESSEDERPGCDAEAPCFGAEVGRSGEQNGNCKKGFPQDGGQICNGSASC